MECWTTKGRSEINSSKILSSRGERESNRREGRMWQIALWTRWRSWIVSPGAPETSNRPMEPNCEETLLAVTKVRFPWRPSRYLTPPGRWKKSIGHPTKSLKLEWTWLVDGGSPSRFVLFCETGIDSFPRGWLFVAVSLFYAAPSLDGSLPFSSLRLSLFNNRRACIVTCILIRQAI